MIADRIEAKWIDLFAEVFARCNLAPGGSIKAPRLKCLSSISLGLSV